MSTTVQMQVSLDQWNAGDARAREQLIARSLNRVRAIAHRMLLRYPDVRRWEETDDVCQRVLERLDKMLRRAVVTDVRAYFVNATYHIRHVLLDLTRKYTEGRWPGPNHLTPGASASGGEPLDAAHPAPGDDPTDLLLWEEIHRRAAALPEELKEVWDLHWYHDLPHPEVAALVGQSLATIKRRWREAKLRIGDGLGPDFDNAFGEKK